MKTKLFITALAAATLGIGFTIRANIQCAQSQQGLKALALPCDEVRGSIAQWEQRLRVAQSTSSDARPESKASPASQTASTAARTLVASGNDTRDKAPAPARRFSAKAIVANDPEKMAAHCRELQGSLDLDYGGMFRALGMSSEQIERFKNLRIEREQLIMDRIGVAEMQGLDRNREAYQALAREHDEMFAKKEAEFFGPLEERYREHLRTQFLRSEVQRLASIEVYPEIPATWAQVERVTEILDRHSQRAPKQSWQLSTWLSVNWDAAAPQLNETLSAGQVVRLRNFAAFDIAMAKVMRQTDRLTAQFKGQPLPR